MINDLTQTIYKELSFGNNILLVGPENSGKTYYTKNVLVPFLKEKKINAVYFENCNVLNNLLSADIFIVDEMETLLDMDFLEKRHPEDKPYYSPIYLEKVKQWHDKLKLFHSPCIFILTRNSKKDMDYILNNIHHTDWGAPVKCLIFKKSL